MSSSCLIRPRPSSSRDETALKLIPIVKFKSSDAEKKLKETAIYESKSKEISKYFCSEYSSMEATERRMVWSNYIRRSYIEIIEAGTLISPRNHDRY